MQMELDPLSDSSADDESDPGSDAEPWEGNLDMEELQERWGMLHNARQEATKEALVDAEQHKRQQRTADRRRETKQEEQEQRKSTALPLVPKSKKAVDRSTKVYRNSIRNKTFPSHRKNSEGDAADGRPNNHSQSEISLPYFSDREMKRGRQLHSSHQRRSPQLSMITQGDDRRRSRSNISDYIKEELNPSMARPASREGRERRQAGSMIALSSKGLPKQRQQL